MTHELYELGKASTQLEGWEWRPRIQSVYALDETDNDAPMYWTSREQSGRGRRWVSIGPYGDGCPQDNRHSAPDLTDDATGGVLLGLLSVSYSSISATGRGVFRLGYRQRWIGGRGHSTPQFRLSDHHHDSGWCDHLAEACARYALVRGYWRRA